MTSNKKRIHVTLPVPLLEAIEALADIECRAVSDVFDDLAREYLRERGFLPHATAEQIAAKMAEKATQPQPPAAPAESNQQPAAPRRATKTRKR